MNNGNKSSAITTTPIVARALQHKRRWNLQLSSNTLCTVRFARRVRFLQTTKLKSQCQRYVQYVTTYIMPTYIICGLFAPKNLVKWAKQGR